MARGIRSGQVKPSGTRAGRRRAGADRRPFAAQSPVLQRPLLRRILLQPVALRPFLLRCGVLLALATAAIAPAQAADDAQARRNYRLHCMGCHQADGSGSPQKGVPDLRAEVGKFLGVDGGRAYLSQVPGALNTPLDDEQTAQVLNYVVRSIAAGGAPVDFRPYTAAEVAAFRRNVPSDILADRARLVDHMADTAGITEVPR